MPFTKKLLRYLGRDTAATTAEANAREPAAREAREASRTAVAAPDTRYDALTVEEVLARLGELTPTGLAKLDRHERGHQNRPAVLAGIQARQNTEPWPGYDELDVPAVRSGLEAADRERLDIVLAYERAHRNRAGVLLAAQQDLSAR